MAEIERRAAREPRRLRHPAEDRRRQPERAEAGAARLGERHDMQLRTEVPYIIAAIGFFSTFSS